MNIEPQLVNVVFVPPLRYADFERRADIFFGRTAVHIMAW